MFDRPRQFSSVLLQTCGIQPFVYHRDRVPEEAAVVVASNHRSFLDPAILMWGLERSVRTVCHYYMSQVPIMNEIVVGGMGCLPLDEPRKRRSRFLHEAERLLRSGEWVGIFPEGAQPMVEVPPRDRLRPFQKGFAHLLLNAEVPDLAVLPVAIASLEENVSRAIPLRWLRAFDYSEPLFDRPERHPVVVYRRVAVLFGHPYWIDARVRQHYRGRQAKQITSELVRYCEEEISHLLQVGCR